jgi:hypothetical protein
MEANVHAHAAVSPPTLTTTCPLCDQRAGTYIADHRGLPRHQLRNGYACPCAGRSTVPVEDDFLLRKRDGADRQAVAQTVRREWERGVTVPLDAATFTRLMRANAREA